MGAYPAFLNVLVIGIPVLLGFVGWTAVRALRKRSAAGCLVPILGLALLLVLVLILVVYPPLS